VTTQPCGLTALSIEGGNQQWQVDLCPSKPEQDGLSFVAPTVANGKVYLPALQAVWAFDDQTGAQIWKTDLSIVGGHNVYSYVTYADGKIFAISNQGVWTLDAQTGAIVWAAHPGVIPMNGGIAVANGTVYALGGGNTVALNENTGATIWSVASPDAGVAISGPVYANGRLYASRNATLASSYLYALDATNGATLWSELVLGSVYTAPAIAGNLVYLSTAGVDLTAYDATTGIPQWSSVTRFLGPWQGITATANGVAYSVSNASSGENTQKLYALNAQTGATLWSYTLPQYETAAGASVAISDGTIYVESSIHNGASYTSSLVAFTPSGSMIATKRGIHSRARG
jgi:outer membrane protein assembly factor BamB